MMFSVAASPDRIATIVYANGDIEYRNVEIKCLESKQDMSPETAINNHQKESSFPFMERNSVGKKSTNIGVRLRCKWGSVEFR